MEKFQLNYDGNLSNLAIAKFSPNLKFLYTKYKNDEVETLKLILNGCQQLESIGVWCDNYYQLNECELLEVVTKYSPKKFHELKIFFPNHLESEIFPKELEPVFINWSNRIPQKSLSLIVIYCRIIGLKIKKESMEVIEKFQKLGVIKKFEIVRCTSTTPKTISFAL